MKFTSDFPGGNGKMINCVKTSQGYDVYFFAETKAREPQPLWFYFRISGLIGKKVVFHLTNAACTLGGLDAWNGNRPVYRFGKEWKRCGCAHTETDELMQSEAVFEIPVDGDEAEVAFCYPYGEKELEKTLSLNPYIKRALIGFSSLGRPMYRYSFSMGDENRTKQGIYITARQHAGEVTGSWLLDGMFRYLATCEGQKLAEKYVIWSVPFVDTDGTELGWYGKDQVWGDLNRSWGPCIMKRPETRAISVDLRNLAKCADIKWVLDLHGPAHGETENYFSYDGEQGTAETDELVKITDKINTGLSEIGRDSIRILFHSNTLTSSQSGYNLDRMCRTKGWHATAFECSYQGDTKGAYTIEDYYTLAAILLKSILEA